ncbi:exported hypothetical protein [Frankia canadensis]|uniref:Uncharacterized protein n=1 Tax=Frankia canadensis TaxID=1836972 RepID=A0A2I2KJ82_9ACTN|nr:exported hypothetical protein [Frankia canadensis]SOU53019.1 exported hypothetical protein [Frankia canadensis]
MRHASPGRVPGVTAVAMCLVSGASIVLPRGAAVTVDGGAAAPGSRRRSREDRPKGMIIFMTARARRTAA